MGMDTTWRAYHLLQPRFHLLRGQLLAVGALAKEKVAVVGQQFRTLGLNVSAIHPTPNAQTVYTHTYIHEGMSNVY